MKTTIKLVLIYLAMQLLGVLIATSFNMAYFYFAHGILESAQSTVLAPAMLLGFIFMTIYLWKQKYLSADPKLWAVPSPAYFLWTMILGASSIVLIDLLMSQLHFLPNWMEQSFDILQSGWLGIVCIAVLGPIVEELLFRGAVTKILLRQYTPTAAIILSGLIFGIFHINPVQVVAASLSGILFAWLYYKTRSLIPVILIHILNNSLSVYLSLRYPNVEYTADLLGPETYLIVIAVAATLFGLSLTVINKCPLNRTNPTAKV